jgi:hypothetical protein
MAKLFVWLYALAGTGYFLMYLEGFDVVQRHAVRLLWVLMVIAPAVLVLLIAWPIAKRLIVLLDGRRA